MFILFFGTAVFNGNVVLPCCPPISEDDGDDEIGNPYENYDANDPTTPLYYVNGDMFRTPRTRTQTKPNGSSGSTSRGGTGDTGGHSTGDFCRSPLLSRSAARRAYRERTVAGFSHWANNGGSRGVFDGSIVTSGGLAPPTINIRVQPSSDPSAVSTIYNQQKKGGENGSSSRVFGRDVSNQRH